MSIPSILWLVVMVVIGVINIVIGVMSNSMINYGAAALVLVAVVIHVVVARKPTKTKLKKCPHCTDGWLTPLSLDEDGVPCPHCNKYGKLMRVLR